MSDEESQGLSENWATLWEAFADAQPDHTAVVIGTHKQTWRELDDRAARLASALQERGAGVGTRIAQLMYNCPEYLESGVCGVQVAGDTGERQLPIQGAGDRVHLQQRGGRESSCSTVRSASGWPRRWSSMPTVTTLVQVDDGSPLVDGRRVVSRDRWCQPNRRSGSNVRGRTR